MRNHPIDENKQRLIDEGIVNPNAVAEFLSIHSSRHLREWIKLISSRVLERLLKTGNKGKELYEEIKKHIINLCEQELAFTRKGCEQLARVILHDLLNKGKITFI